ncbi:hypothetical protein Fcan01_18215 [Folsomia candida]|uniref:Uncharacterized protein n=1 Tax=Folsomia candida TaxID=158441 RepID=A0A226DMD2_FOLCA|nr:hypothetical protein Fcan01_18215 [Folsomia candida]
MSHQFQLARQSCRDRLIIKRNTDKNAAKFENNIVPILTPAAEIATAAVASADSYLPDLGFWADVGSLMLSGSSLSPMARLSRDVFESQECAEFLQDLPFRGDLADRLKMGSSKSIRGDQKCGFDCSPLQYLNRGVKTLSLLHAVTRAANPRIDLRDL